MPVGPDSAPMAEAESIMPWVAPTNLVPNMSASKAGMQAYEAPKKLKISSVEPVRPHRHGHRTASAMLVTGQQDRCLA